MVRTQGHKGTFSNLTSDTLATALDHPLLSAVLCNAFLDL